MSGRGAYARKKNTTVHQKHSFSRPPSSTASDHDDISVRDFPIPPGPVGTGVGTTNARFLKFSDSAPQMMDPRGWNIPGAIPPPGTPYGAPVQGDWAYGRQRKPTIRTEDVSGIEKSGLRSIMDKRSDGVRKGLAKTFAFRKKDREDGRRGSVDRPPSAIPFSSNAYAEEPHHYQETSPISPPPMPVTMPVTMPVAPYAGYQPQQLPSPTSPSNFSPPAWDMNPIGPPPTSKLPPIPQASSTPMPPIKRWIGAGRPVGRWNKLRKDPELWDPNGDVLVFLGRKGQSRKLQPSFRLSSHIIEATESRYLITLLREGSNEEDIHLPPSPAGAPPMVPRHREGQLTPPTSEDTSIGDDLDGQVSYEMYFPTPSNLKRVEQLRHQITTRNVFALLYQASLVGLSLYQALSDLHTRLDSYMSPGTDTVSQIIKYLAIRGIDDVRSDPETAISLLSWSEGSEVRWEDGWRECFVHCAGMYGRELERCADFKYTTPIARALLERASLETQLRVQAAEERLCEFSFGDMWPDTSYTANSVARAASDRLRQMLLSHYSRVYGCWPPPCPSRRDFQPGSPTDTEISVGDDVWLTRTVVMALQKDFGALYDYLVDRDVAWDVSEARSGRKWMMVSESNRSFEADSPDLPMTDVLIEFDNKFRYPHIPHPYPLIPESIPLPSAGKEGGIFKRSGKAAPQGGRAGALERRVQLAYTESTNIYSLGSDFVPSELVDAFVKMEKSDRIGEVDPAVARRGRWVLIYGILQTLASVSVDDASVRYAENVPYHLNPRLKGTRIPPWRVSRSTSAGMGEASHEASYCWMAPRGWGMSRPESDVESLGESGRESPVVGGPMGPGPGGVSGWSSGDSKEGNL